MGWRLNCRARWVMQQDAQGCGVACLAMLSGAPYADVRRLFIERGLDKPRGRSKPFASNFRELMGVAASLGLSGSMRRWAGWGAVQGLGIVKVPSGAPPNWHWMVVERTRVHGLVAQDPAIDWPAFENPPLDVMYRRPESIKPYGNWVSFT